MTTSGENRRWILGGALLLIGGGFLVRRRLASGATPQATEGPFYPAPSMRMADVDNDLVKVVGAVKRAGGEVVILKGRILHRDGAPRVGHRIEIWQCDANGRYLHPGDSQAVAYDTGFQGFGGDVTDSDGRYWFRTIKPVRYPGRAPHIHVKVFDRGRELLTTQFYIAGSPDNETDGGFTRLSRAQAESVSMVFETTSSGLETTVDITI